MRDSKRDTDVKNRLLDSVGEGEGGMIWENSIICDIDRQTKFDAWDRVLRAGALGWLWVMGWGGRWEGGSGWGTHGHPWLSHVNVWQKPAQCFKVIAAAAKLLQSCLTLWDPINSSPAGSPVSGILQARTLEWIAIFFSNAWKGKVKVKSFSRVRLFVTPWTAA